MSNAGLMVSQEFPSPGKRKLRGDLAYKEAQADLEQYRQVRLDVISRLRQAYHRLRYACEVIDLNRRNLELLRKFLRVTEARYAVGKAAQQDILKAQTQLSALEARLVRLEQERRSREAEVNALVNRPLETPVPRPPAVEPAPFLHTLEQLAAQAEQNAPALGREQRVVEQREIALNLARKDFYPDYALSAGYFNMGGMPDMYEFRLSLNLPVYFWRKQRAGVAEQVHSLREARAGYAATRQGLLFRVKDDYLMAEASHRLLNLYATTLVPQASLTLESSLASYETGAVDFLTLLTNLMAVVEYESNYYEELLNYHLALIRLEELTGVKLLED